MPEIRKAFSLVRYDLAASPFLYSDDLYRFAAAFLPDKVLFGSDYPLLALSRYKPRLDGLEEAGQGKVPLGQREAVFWGPIGIIPRRKLMIVEWDPARPKKKTTALIKESLENGSIISYPTDTFYGLGCDLFNTKAIRTLYAMRGLSEKRPLSIIFKDIKDISEYAVLTDFAFRILKSMLPGAYTFILRAKRAVPRLLQTAKKELGVRMPDHAIPRALVDLLGRPIINTTAKSAGLVAASDPREIEQYFKNQVAFVIDGGIIAGEPSTVISLVDDRVQILREGKGPLTDLLRGVVLPAREGLFHFLFKPLAQLVAELAAHSLHQLFHGPRVILVEVSQLAGIEKILHPLLLAPDHGNPGEDPSHGRRLAALAVGLECLVSPEEQKRRSSFTGIAIVFVNGHARSLFFSV